MAKNKKNKKPTSKKGSRKGSKASSKKTAAKSSAPDGFWHQAAAFGLLIIAVLVLFGSFGSGGPLAEMMFEWGQWMTGVVAYILPLALIAVAIIKIRSDNHRLDRSIFWGFVILFMAASGFAHLFIADDQSLIAANNGEGGGFIGHLADTVVLGLLDNITGGIVLFAVALVALHFVFKLPLTHFFKFIRLSKKESKQSGDDDSPVRVSKEPKPVFTLNEGVPLQRARSSLKNSAKPLSEKEQHEALTTTGDPDWNFPSLDLLNKTQDKADAGDIEGNAKIIKDTLGDFKIKVEMQGANVGPRVTQFTLAPPNGVRLTKITALENNLALNLAATSIRIEAPIPGKRAVGIEVPNQKTATVRLHSILSSNQWSRSGSPLSFAIGKDIAGEPVVGELDKMPHMLIAGATGSGKSVMINSFLMSLLYKNSPADLKLILVDPKQVELTPYNDIPHLLTPVITQPEKCISALKWAVAEMERRYTYLSETGKKDINSYNAAKKGEAMPYIVIVIDELADLMMVAARDVEALVVRIAQKARAVGIHLVLATQRPSVDVITGLIKANVPARFAFTTTSQVDSRTIIDQGGAEKLLGRGDMLMHTPDLPKPKRVQGSMVDEPEVEKVTDFIRMEKAPQYDDEIVSQPVRITGGSTILSGGSDNEDSLYDDAIQVVVDAGKASTSLLQRRLRVGYSRAARLMESLEDQGVISAADGSRPREVLINSIDDIIGADDTPNPDTPPEIS